MPNFRVEMFKPADESTPWWSVMTDYSGQWDIATGLIHSSRLLANAEMSVLIINQSNANG